MTEPGDGSVIADKGWPARKLYLSPEAIALMENHCKGTPLTMSAYVDMLIKRDLTENPYLPPDYKVRLTDEASTITPEMFEAAQRIAAENDKRTVAPVPSRARIPTSAAKKDFDIDV